MDTSDLADRLSAVLNARPFNGNKRAAYRIAGVSPQTFDRALAGQPIRADKQAEIADFISKHEGIEEFAQPDLSDPEALVLATKADLRELRREVLGRIADLEREVGGSGGDTAAIVEAGFGRASAPTRKAARRGKRQATDEPGDGD